MQETSIFLPSFLLDFDDEDSVEEVLDIVGRWTNALLLDNRRDRRAFSTTHRRCLSSHRIRVPRSTRMTTIGKLTFSNKFCGRVEEIKRLHEAYLSLGTESAAVFVGGYSGTGKTRLIHHAVLELQSNKGGDMKPFLFCSGKADESLSTDPFSSLVKAMAQLLRGLEPNERPIFRERILHVVGSEGKVLTDLIPELEELIGKQPESQSSPSASNSLNRFRYLFQKMVNAISTPEKPLIMFLDDLQWTDASSLELVRSLLTYPELKHFLFLAAYRDNEVDEDHPLSKIFASLDQDGKCYVSLPLRNMSVGDVRVWLEDTLRSDSVDELVEVLHAKTHGNIFYLRACLSQLEQKQILQYSVATCMWAWDT